MFSQMCPLFIFVMQLYHVEPEKAKLFRVNIHVDFFVPYMSLLPQVSEVFVTDKAAKTFSFAAFLLIRDILGLSLVSKEGNYVKWNSEVVQ